MTRIVTFYSYKGGVGRTMALVNTAHVLARDGWRVLMVDFDLEAPGMTHFFADVVRNRPQAVEYDALDLLLHAKRSLVDSESPEMQSVIPDSLAEYVVNIKLPVEWTEKGSGGIPYRNGRLDLLPATLEPLESEEPPESEPAHDYLRRMDELDLSGIFSRDGPRHRFGDHVRKYLKNARFLAIGDVLFTMRDRVKATYDIVLIDSRTGLNEISGLCIGPLCDALVICAGLNRQNIYGTHYFMEKAGLLDREKAKPYIVVAGPVPVWHSRESEAQVTALSRALLADNIVRVPYHPMAAISETVFVTEDPNDPIAAAYEELAPKVAGLVADVGMEELSHRVMRALMEGEEGQVSRDVAQRLAENRLGRTARRFPPLGILSSFPTACTVPTIPIRGHRELDWHDVENISLAAAVSAYRLRSDRPFRRAWRLLSWLKGDETTATDLALRLLFFQLRVLGTAPSEDPAAEILANAVAKAREAKEERIYGARAVVLLDALTVGFQAIGYESAGNYRHRSESDAKRFMSIAEKSEILAAPRMGRWRFPFPMFRVPHDSLSSFVLEMTKPPEEASRETLTSFSAGAELPFPPEELHRRPLRFIREFFHPGMMEEMMFRPEKEGRPIVPLGFWQEPLVASVTAFVKGAAAVDQTLAWIALSKLAYGYAWRVLVDWRYLETARNHPAFSEFLHSEDSEINEVESAIDRGEYPL